MPIYDFICTNGHVEEHIQKTPYCTPICDCGAESVYKPTMPYIANMRMGADPHGCPTAADKWAKAHQLGGKATLAESGIKT